MSLFRVIGVLILGGFIGCSKEQIVEFPTVLSSSTELSEIRLVSYNIHGGVGPNGEGTFNQNLQAFRDILMGEQLICMQEVEPGCWNALKSIYPAFPYRFYLPQRSTKFGTSKDGGNAILSKLPITAYDHKLINTDPGGDKWERKAQYIRCHIGKDFTTLHLFHYHNTYNWHNNNSSAEKLGFKRFVAWVDGKAIPPNEILVITGDFNLSKSQVDEILGNRFHHSNSSWVDHIYSSTPQIDQGIYPTVLEDISDHNALWSILCNSEC